MRKKKVPNKSVSPDTKYIKGYPRKSVSPADNLFPDFKTDMMESRGKWSFDRLSFKHLQTILNKLFEFQKLTWAELKNHGCHLVEVCSLCKEAQCKLYNSNSYEPENLYSFRLSSTQRLWGIKDKNIIWLLWWDPNHEVCFSKKKHT